MNKRIRTHLSVGVPLVKWPLGPMISFLFSRKPTTDQTQGCKHIHSNQDREETLNKNKDSITKGCETPPLNGNLDSIQPKRINIILGCQNRIQYNQKRLVLSLVAQTRFKTTKEEKNYPRSSYSDSKQPKRIRNYPRDANTKFNVNDKGRTSPSDFQKDQKASWNNKDSGIFGQSQANKFHYKFKAITKIKLQDKEIFIVITRVISRLDPVLNGLTSEHSRRRSTKT